MPDHVYQAAATQTHAGRNRGYEIISDILYSYTIVYAGLLGTSATH